MESFSVAVSVLSSLTYSQLVLWVSDFSRMSCLLKGRGRCLFHLGLQICLPLAQRWQYSMQVGTCCLLFHTRLFKPSDICKDQMAVCEEQEAWTRWHAGWIQNSSHSETTRSTLLMLELGELHCSSAVKLTHELSHIHCILMGQWVFPSGTAQMLGDIPLGKALPLLCSVVYVPVVLVHQCMCCSS